MRFRILHISDLHERVETPDTKPDRLAKMAYMRAQRYRVLEQPFFDALDDVLKEGPIDFVCFTGDVADWGLDEEYEAATKRVQAILDKLGLPASRFLAVPGNHDVNRNKAGDALTEARRLVHRELEPLARWLRGLAAPNTHRPNLKTEMRDRTKAFWQWLARVRGDADLSPKEDGHLGYRYSVPEFGVHFIGLDSAWLAHDEHDRSYLFVPTSQIDLLARDDKTGAPLGGARIALIHHPLTDLIENYETYTRLADNVDLLLHGHQHHQSAMQISEPSRRLYILAAGSLFEGDEGDRWVNSFQTIDVTLGDHGSPRQFDMVFYGWSKAGHWHRTGALYPQVKDGKYRWEVGAKKEPPATPVGLTMRDAATRVLGDMRRGPLRFVDDAAILGPVRVEGTSIDVAVDTAYDETRDEIAEPTYAKDYQAAKERWEDAGYDEGIAAYIEANAKVLEKDDHRCKLGFSAFHPTVDGGDLNRPALRVRPINHIVCQSFNRGLARDRLSAEAPEAELLWNRSFRRLLQGPGGSQVYRAHFPSQLFVELALVTSDGFVPLAIKDNPTSVYAERGNPYEIWTCGIEDGPNWGDAVADRHAQGRTTLQFDNMVLKGLAREYRVRGAPTTKNGKPILPNERALDCPVPPVAGLFSLAVQTMHLNTALLGYCVLPLTRQELFEHLTTLPTRQAGGLIFDALEFVHLDDCEKRVDRYKHSLRWHGTALMRLLLLSQHREEVDSHLAAFRDVAPRD